jgi:hypothetical protein
MITRDKLQNRPMNFLGGLFSGDSGANWQAEYAASPAQAQQLYNQQQQALRNQQAFTQALQMQTPQAIQQQMMLGRELAGAVQGQGPSVAQAQLAETTGQNVARQQAMLAGQRGASANVGLLARNIAQTGAQTQQQAAGQAATLRAQEQLAARQQLAALSGQQLGQVQGAQQLGVQGTTAAQQNILDAIARRNQTQAIIASGNQAFQSGLVGGLIGGAGQAIGGGGFAEGGEVTKDKEDEKEKEKEETAGQRFAKGFQAGMTGAQGNYQAGAQAGMGAGKAIGGALAGLFKPGVQGQTQGGYAGANLGVPTQMPAPVNPVVTPQTIGQMQIPQYQPGFAEGGKVPAMVSPGEKYLPPQEVKKVAAGQKEPHKAGVKIPGQAKVAGDSLKNDTVPMTLEEGGIVIPRSVMNSKDPAEQARKFVAAVLAKKQSKRK